jgi:hypothetical protein
MCRRNCYRVEGVCVGGFCYRVEGVCVCYRVEGVCVGRT